MKSKLNKSTVWGLIGAALSVAGIAIGVAQANAADEELDALVEEKVRLALSCSDEES